MSPNVSIGRDIYRFNKAVCEMQNMRNPLAVVLFAHFLLLLRLPGAATSRVVLSVVWYSCSSSRPQYRFEFYGFAVPGPLGGTVPAETLMPW